MIKKFSAAAITLAITATFATADPVITPGHSLPTITFPTITSTDLNGRTVTVPQDLNGQRQLILIGYEQADQKIIDPWLDVARSWHRPETELGIYELPVIDDPGKAMRIFINTGMKAGIRDKDVRRRVITLYTNKQALLNKLGINSDKTIDVLVLDSRGNVTWRESGQLTADKQADLESHLGLRR